MTREEEREYLRLRDRVGAAHDRAARARLDGAHDAERATRASCSSRRAASSTTPTPPTTSCPTSSTSSGTPFLVVPYSKVYNDVKYFLAPTYANPRRLLREPARAASSTCSARPARGHGGRMMTRRDPLALERPGAPRLGGARLRRVRARARRRLLHAPRRHRAALARAARRRAGDGVSRPRGYAARASRSTRSARSAGRSRSK